MLNILIGHRMRRPPAQRDVFVLQARHPRPQVDRFYVVLDYYGSARIPKEGLGFPAIRAGSSTSTPTSVSSSNAVQAFFAKLARRTCRRGVFRSLVDLQSAIGYPADYNARSKPFIWSTKPGTVIAATSRGYQTSKSIH